MSIEAARLVAVVEADTAKAESGISRFGSSLGKIGSIAAGLGLERAFQGAASGILGLAEAAANDAASVAGLQQAFQNAGASLQQYGGQIDNAVKQGQALAFSDDQVRGALQTLVQTTGNAGEAMKRLHTAEDLARGTGMDLNTASRLLGKTTDENVNVLKRYGIAVEKGATAQDLLNKVDARFGGQSAKFAESAAGQWAIAKDRLSEAGESMGYIVLPAFTAFATFAAQTLVPTLQSLIDRFGPRLARAAQTATAALTTLYNFLHGPLMSIWTQLRDSVQTFVDALKGDWVNASGILPLHKIVGELGLLIRSVLIPAWDALSGVIDTVKGHFDDIMGVVKPLATVMAGPLALALKGALAGFGKKGIAGILPGAIQGLKDFGTAFGTLGGIIKDALGKIDWGALGQTILDGIGGALSSIGSIASSVDWAGIAGDMLTALSNALSKTTAVVWDAGAWVIAAVTGVNWSAAATTILTGLANAMTTVTTVTWDAAAWLKSALGGGSWADVATTIIADINAALKLAATGPVGLAWDVALWVHDHVAGQSWTEVAASIQTGISTALTDASTAAGIVWDAALSIAAWISAVQWTPLATTILTHIRDALYLVAGLTWDVAATIATWIAAQDWSGIASFILTHIRDGMVAVAGIVWDAAQWIIGIIGTTSWSDVASFIATQIGNAIKTLPDIASGIVDSITGQGPAFVAAGVTVGEQIRTGVETGTATGAAPDSKTFWERFIPDAAPYLDPLTADIGTHAEAIVKNVKEIFSALDVFSGSTSWILNLGFLKDALGAVDAALALFALHGVDELTKLGDYISQFILFQTQALVNFGGTLKNAANDALGWMTDTGANIIQGIIDGIDGAWSTLTDKIGEIQGAVTGAISDPLSWLNPAGGDTITGMVNGITGAWGDLTGKVGEIQGAVIGAVVGAASWLILSGGDVIRGFVDGMTQVFDSIAGKAGEIEGSVEGAVSGAATWLYQAGYDAIAGFVKGINDAISNLDPVGIVTAVGNRVAGAFSHLTHSPWPSMIKIGYDAIHGLAIGIETADAQYDPAATVAKIGEEMLALLTTAIKSGQTDAAKAAAETVTSIVDAFNGLIALGESLKTATFPGIAQISQLKFITEHAVKSIADSAALFTGPGMAAAKTFADTGKAIFDLFGSVLTAFSQQIVIPDNSTISQLKFAVEHAVRSIADSAAMFTTDGLTQAQAFADAAGPIVALLKDAVDAFASMQTLTGSVSFAPIDALVQFVRRVVAGIQDAASGFSTDGLAAASAFGASVKDVIGWITDGIKAFEALTTFNYKPVVNAAITVLVNFAAYVTASLVQAAGRLNPNKLEAATKFGAAIKDTIGWITGAVDAFAALSSADFSASVTTGIDALLAMVDYAVRSLIVAAGRLGTDGIDAAKLYADAAGSILDLIGKASNFDALKDFSGNIKGGIAAFFADIKLAIGMLIDLGRALDGGLTEATAIATKISKIVDLLTPSAATMTNTASGGGSASGGGGGGGGASGGGGYEGPVPWSKRPPPQYTPDPASSIAANLAAADKTIADNRAADRAAGGGPIDLSTASIQAMEDAIQAGTQAGVEAANGAQTAMPTVNVSVTLDSRPIAAIVSTLLMPPVGAI